MHIEFLVEEESSAEVLNRLVPKIAGDRTSFFVHVFQGKMDLMARLPERLRGYSKWLPADWEIVVLVDRDGDDCGKLKARLERIAGHSGLVTRTGAKGRRRFQLLNRIAIEELEAWFFGDVEALIGAYPGVPDTLANKRGFRDPDAIAGGTWEALERVFRHAGYYRSSMPKIEVARNVAAHMVPERNRSRSFQVFCEGLRAICA